MSFAERYLAIRRRASGTREKEAFEYTFGTPREELAHIAPVSPAVRRILAETDFAIKLNEEKGGAFDGEIERALGILQKALDEDAALTNAACGAAEEALLPLKASAKEYTVLCAAHAHIDMNWMWGWPETVAATLATFRTMLRLMDEYPDFCFSQSQASVYKIVEDYAPEMMPEMQKRIREGRWEITATAWVETDKNMPDTESLLRHISSTKKYFKEHWQIDPDSLEIDFSPDTFGHSAQIPEIDAFGGVRYMYHCRGFETDEVLYRWHSPSGKELLVYREPYWYNSGITPDVGTGLLELSHHSGGLKTGLIVYGVGDHGGGPTRRDAERILEMHFWPVFPDIRFGTFREYFHKAESVREKLPVVAHELNFFATGCYTTQSRIKRGNRRAEAALLDAQALCALTGEKALWPEKNFERAWQETLFTHFHDILTGSCVQDSREYAMGLFADVMAVADTAHANALRALSDQTDTSMIKTDDDVSASQSEGAGVGYGIKYALGIPNPERGKGRVRIYQAFNPCAFQKNEVVELTVWDWPFDRKRVRVTDEAGAAVPFQLADAELQHYWDHKFFRVLAQVTLPPFGYATLVVDEAPLEQYQTFRLNGSRIERVHEDILLENENLRAVFDRSTGALKSLIDLATGEERLAEGREGALTLIETEASSSSAWNIGRYLSEASPEAVRVTPFAGELRSGFTLEQKLLSSFIKTTVTLDAGANALHFSFEIDWNEYAKPGENVPVLIYRLPLQGQESTYRMDIPAGVTDRNEDREDVPALNFDAALFDGGARAAALVTDCKYGYRNDGGALSCTLINTAGNPDPYPERGKHMIRLFMMACAGGSAALKRGAVNLTHGAGLCSASAHPGSLPAHGSLMDVESDGCVVTSLSRSEDGALTARVMELEGKESSVRFTPRFVCEKALLTDLAGHPLGQAAVEAGTVSFSVQPLSLAQVSLYPRE